MGIFDKLLGKKRKIPLIKDAYVNSCFNFDFKEENEERHFYEMEDLNEIFHQDLNELVNIPEKATVSVEKAIKEYPDFDVLYTWLGTCYSKRELNKPEKAREICLEGLRKCRRKSYLCGKLGMLEFESNNLPEAVKWWIRSCAVQSVGGQYLDGFSFLNLATIAKYLGLNECYHVLFDKSKKIQYIIFDAIGESEKASIVREQGNNSIEQAITLLCKHYF